MEKITIGRIDVPVVVQEIEDICSIRVKVGTNGLKGGDSDHGSRTYFQLDDLGGAVIHGGFRETPQLRKDYKSYYSDNIHSLGFSFRGDQELRNFISILSFSLSTLCGQANIAPDLSGIDGDMMADELRRRGYQIIDPAFNVPQDNLTFKERIFFDYLYDLTKMYKETGSLKGMSLIRQRYNISSITKDTFYRTGLNTLDDVEWLTTKEGKCFAQALYKKVCKKDFDNIKPEFAFTKEC